MCILDIKEKRYAILEYANVSMIEKELFINQTNKLEKAPGFQLISTIPDIQ